MLLVLVNLYVYSGIIGKISLRDGFGSAPDAVAAVSIPYAVALIYLVEIAVCILEQDILTFGETEENNSRPYIDSCDHSDRTVVDADTVSVILIFHFCEFYFHFLTPVR